MARVKRPVGDRFLEKVDRSNPAGCWQWTACTNKDGYGSFSVGKKVLRAHRLMYSWVKGSIPNGSVVRHTCDNPGCVNPDHLLLGSQKDNVGDMMRRGRWASGRGNKKVSEEDVREIKRLYGEGLSVKSQIAPEFELSDVQVYNILSGRSWSEVGSPVTLEKRSGKMTEKEVAQIKSIRGRSHSDIAKEFNVSQPTISRILSGKTWKHVSACSEVTYG